MTDTGRLSQMVASAEKYQASGQMAKAQECLDQAVEYWRAIARPRRAVRPRAAIETANAA
jgi:hypothetical protein